TYPLQFTRMKHRLIIGSKEFAVPPEGLTIGRDPFNTITVEDDRVSAFHCRVEADQDRFVVVDCDSLNGTYVNGREIGRVRLEDGDQIRVGRTILQFFAGDSFDSGPTNNIRLEEGEDLDGRTTVFVDPSESVFINTQREIRSELDR